MNAIEELEGFWKQTREAAVLMRRSAAEAMNLIRDEDGRVELDEESDKMLYNFLQEIYDTKWPVPGLTVFPEYLNNQPPANPGIPGPIEAPIPPYNRGTGSAEIDPVSMATGQEAEIRDLLTKISPYPWHPGHLSDDNSSCNCQWVFSPNYMGSVCTVDIHNGIHAMIGADGNVLDKIDNDCPPLEEAKANQRFIAMAPEYITGLLNEVACFRAQLKIN